MDGMRGMVFFCCDTKRAIQTAGGEKLTDENIDTVPQEQFDEYLLRLYQYLQVVETRLFSEGLHVLGHAPSSSQLEQYLGAYFGDELSEAAVAAVSTHGEHDAAAVRAALGAAGTASAAPRLEEAVEIRDLLLRNTEEMDGVLKALNGEFVLPVRAHRLQHP